MVLKTYYMLFDKTVISVGSYMKHIAQSQGGSDW